MIEDNMVVEENVYSILVYAAKMIDIKHYVGVY